MNMYKIKWTRCAGEEGVFAQEFTREYEAQEAIRALLKVDELKEKKDVYKYEIISY